MVQFTENMGILSGTVTAKSGNCLEIQLKENPMASPAGFLETVSNANERPKERGFNNIRFLTCLFVRLLCCRNSCVASYAPVSTP